MCCRSDFDHTEKRKGRNHFWNQPFLRKRGITSRVISSAWKTPKLCVHQVMSLHTNILTFRIHYTGYFLKVKQKKWFEPVYSFLFAGSLGRRSFPVGTYFKTASLACSRSQSASPLSHSIPLIFQCLSTSYRASHRLRLSYLNRGKDRVRGHRAQ